MKRKSLHDLFCRCYFCHWKKAEWIYMPSGGLACDECVPRGCSCNTVPKEGIDPNSDDWHDPENWEEILDDNGRRLPCCEWEGLP